MVALAILPKKKRGEEEGTCCLDLVFAQIQDEMIYVRQHQEQKLRAALFKSGYQVSPYVTRDRTPSYFPLLFVNFPPAAPMHSYITPEKSVPALGLEDFYFHPGDD